MCLLEVTLSIFLSPVIYIPQWLFCLLARKGTWSSGTLPEPVLRMRPRPRTEQDRGRRRLVSTVVRLSRSFGSPVRLGTLVVLSCCGSAWKKKHCPWKPAPLVPPAASSETQMPQRVHVFLFLACFVWPVARWREVWSLGLIRGMSYKCPPQSQTSSSKAYMRCVEIKAKFLLSDCIFFGLEK